MSMPTSAIAATAEGFTWSPGMLPAERTSTCPLLRWIRNPAAICDRPALCTQTNRTLGLSDMGWVPFEENGCRLGVVQDLAEQGGDAGLDVVTDRPDHLDGLAGRVGDIPVFVAFAGQDRAGAWPGPRPSGSGRRCGRRRTGSPGCLWGPCPRPGLQPGAGRGRSVRSEWAGSWGTWRPVPGWRAPSRLQVGWSPG